MKEKRGLHPAILFLVAVVAIAGGLMSLVVLKRKDPDPGAPVVAAPKRNVPAPIAREEHQQDHEHFIEQGWKDEASKALSGFLQARSAEEKARYVIGSDVLGSEMANFYRGASEIDESDTPIEGFSHQALDIVDRRRGLFLMRFERPSQLKMSEFFRPVVPLEIQYDLKEPGLLLSSLASRDRFAMDPVRVMAFFKEVDGTLLLDWHVYTQTKYRIFKHFITGPRPGVGGVFRVMVREALPASAAETSAADTRTFRLSDPAFGQDRITVVVPNDGLSGRVLSQLAWINMPDRSDQNRYATVRLSWTEEPESHIHLDEVICWEFLGLGGEIGNADPLGEDAPGEDGSKEPVLPVLSEETTPVSVQEDVIPEETTESAEGEGAGDTTGQGEEEESATAPSLRE
ncbi:MAG: hypothetical protein MK194_08310 [Roseibacillus sp.]|nr:hypothetical protein [Roseibacillus sp.]